MCIPHLYGGRVRVHVDNFRRTICCSRKFVVLLLFIVVVLLTYEQVGAGLDLCQDSTSQPSTEVPFVSGPGAANRLPRSISYLGSPWFPFLPALLHRKERVQRRLGFQRHGLLSAGKDLIEWRDSYGPL